MKNTNNENSPEIPWKGIVGLLIIIPIMLATLLLSAGSFDWWEAWAYTGSGLLVLIGSRVVMILKNPDLALERSQALGKEDVKEWDKFLMPFTALIAPFISWIVAGLDQRFGWSSDLPNWIQIFALVVIQLGSLVGSWAMVANRFFSSQVRIQTDRGHSVVREGPYKYVRHPGYAGGLVSWLGCADFLQFMVVDHPHGAGDNRFCDPNWLGRSDFAGRITRI